MRTGSGAKLVVALAECRVLGRARHSVASQWPASPTVGGLGLFTDAGRNTECVHSTHGAIYSCDITSAADSRLRVRRASALPTGLPEPEL